MSLVPNITIRMNLIQWFLPWNVLNVHLLICSSITISHLFILIFDGQFSYPSIFHSNHSCTYINFAPIQPLIWQTLHPSTHPSTSPCIIHAPIHPSIHHSSNISAIHPFIHPVTNLWIIHTLIWQTVPPTIHASTCIFILWYNSPTFHPSIYPPIHLITPSIINSPETHCLTWHAIHPIIHPSVSSLTWQTIYPSIYP